MPLANVRGALPACVGGRSSGCRLSLMFALRYPQAVRGLRLWRITGGPYAAERLAARTTTLNDSVTPQLAPAISALAPPESSASPNPRARETMTVITPLLNKLSLGSMVVCSEIIP